MHELHELKEKLIKELEDYSQNGKFSKDDVEAIKYMASAVDHLCNIISDMDDDGYSNRGSMRSRNYGYGYEGGQGGNNSYARGRGSNARRDSMGRYSSRGGYSRAEGAEGLVEEIRGMMGELPDHIRQDAQRLVQKLEQEM